jgi:phenylpropionate dioxygenase-like ring-hydroxylating dioxygenase large terminal subunit
VLWRDGGGVVRAFADRCPHRGAKFSLGCVRHGELECPYHGWRFDGSGQAVAVPALPAFVPPATHRATTHAAVDRYGLVWVCLDAAASADDVPAFPAEDDPRLRKVGCGPYDVAASAPRIVENFLDMAHFGFVHEGWLGARDHVALPDHRVDATPTGFIATQCKAWQPQSSVNATGGAEVEYTYEVNAPYTAVLTKVPDGAVQIEGFRESIALFTCPVTEDTSRVWFRLAMNDFESSDQTLRAFQDTIFSQDRPVLESQTPKRLPISTDAPVRELHSAADRSAAAYRRYLRERGITFGAC